MIIKLELFLLTATVEREEGNLLDSRAAERGKSVDFVRLLYIIRLYSSPIYRRRRGIEYNYMLCIIALSWVFSGATFLLLVGGLKQWF